VVYSTPLTPLLDWGWVGEGGLGREKERREGERGVCPSSLGSLPQALAFVRDIERIFSARGHCYYVSQEIGWEDFYHEWFPLQRPD